MPSQTVAAACLRDVVLLVCLTAGPVAAHRGQSGAATHAEASKDAETDLNRKAVDLLKNYTGVSVTPREAGAALDGDPALKRALSHHDARGKPTAALQKRARGARGMSAAALDQAVRRKETECNCFVQEAENVDADLYIDTEESHVALRLDLLERTTHASSFDLAFVAMDSVRTYRSAQQCQKSCFDECKEHAMCNIEPSLHEAITEVTGAGMPIVGAQCDGPECRCVRADDTENNFRFLSGLHDDEGGKFDPWIIQETLEDEATCLKTCKGRCDRFDDPGRDVNVEGVCSDYV